MYNGRHQATCFTQLKAQGPSRTCHERKEEEEAAGNRRARNLARDVGAGEGFATSSLCMKAGDLRLRTMSRGSQLWVEAHNLAT